MNKRIKTQYKEYSAEINDILIHLHILVLRKSAGKLIELNELLNDRSTLAKMIIDVKYQISQCRPEVVNILHSMAREPSRFEMDDSWGENIISLQDTVNKTRFRFYNWSSSRDSSRYTVHINGHEFLTPIETTSMAHVAKSLQNMNKNQYKLEQELQTLEEERKVFEIYKVEDSK